MTFTSVITVMEIMLPTKTGSDPDFVIWMKFYLQNASAACR